MSGGSSYGSCCYADCTNSYSTNSKTIFFKFPNDDARRKKWIANCGNPEVAQLSDRHLRGKRICALHFPDSSFSDTKKESLNDKAVPNKYTKEKSEPVEEASETPVKRQRGGRQPVKPPESPATPAQVKSRRGSETTEAKAKTPERTLRTKRVADKADTEKKDSLTDKAVPAAKSPKVKQAPVESDEEGPPVLKKAAESPKRAQSPAAAESPKRRGGRQPAKATETPAKDTTKPPAPDVKPKIAVVETVAPKTKRNVAKIQSTFGKSLYTLLNSFLYDEEPTVRNKRPLSKSDEVTGTGGVVMNRTPVRLANGRAIKTEVFEPSEKMPRFQKLPAIRPVGQGKSSRMIEQFVNIGGGAGSGNLILQNGEFTLAEGQEYEVIGESDAHEQMQVMDGDNNEIEIIEVDDQTMAQLTAQNMFFQNSGNIQVTELDPNMGQILKVINPQEAYFHQYQQ